MIFSAESFPLSAGTPSSSWREAARLIRRIEEQGAVFIRHGGEHDWYQNPKTKFCQPVPRYNEINDHLARAPFSANFPAPKR